MRLFLILIFLVLVSGVFSIQSGDPSLDTMLEKYNNDFSAVVIQLSQRGIQVERAIKYFDDLAVTLLGNMDIAIAWPEFLALGQIVHKLQDIEGFQAQQQQQDEEFYRKHYNIMCRRFLKEYIDGLHVNDFDEE